MAASGNPTGPALVLPDAGNNAGRIVTVDEALAMTQAMIDTLKRQLQAIPETEPTFSDAAWNLAVMLQQHYEIGRDLDILMQAIEVLRRAIRALPPGRPDRSDFLRRAAHCLWTRFKWITDLEHLRECHSLFREALPLIPVESPLHAICMADVGRTLSAGCHHGLFGEEETHEAISMLREAMSVLAPLGGQTYEDVTYDLAEALAARGIDNLDDEATFEAIPFFRQAMQTRSQHSDLRLRLVSFMRFGLALRTAFERSGDLDYLNEAITCYREELKLLLPDSNMRVSTYERLAEALIVRFSHVSETDALSEALVNLQDALRLCPAADPAQRSRILTLMADVLRLSSIQSGDPDLIRQSSALSQEALLLVSPLQRDRAMALNNAAVHLHTSISQHWDLSVAAEVVRLHREALSLRPLGHPERPQSLLNLAQILLDQFKQLGYVQALEEGVELLEQSLKLCPPGHPSRTSAQSGLASAYTWSLPFATDRAAVLSEVISLERDVLGHSPPGNRARNSALQNLATSLLSKCELEGDLVALQECIDLAREAFQSSHGERLFHGEITFGLARALRYQSKQIGDSRIHAEAIELHRHALEMMPAGHSERLVLLHGMTEILTDEQTATKESVLEAIEYIMDMSSESGSSHRLRLRRGIASLEALVSACEQLERQEEGDVIPLDKMLDAHVVMLQLLPRVASFDLQQHARLDALSGTGALTRDAAAYALHLGRIEQAVEILEEGRGVFWQQALSLRSAALDVLPGEERMELQELFGALEKESLVARPRGAQPEDWAIQELRVESRRKLDERAESVIRAIRTRPGFERFLLPKAFCEHSKAITTGYAVILLSSRLGCYAIAMSGTMGPICVPLHDVSGLLNPLEVKVKLPRDATVGVQELDAELSRLSIHKSKRRKEELGEFDRLLEEIWMRVVRPVVTALGLEKATGRGRPWVRWITTGNFSLLPIHAAGIYRGADQQCASDYMVSSYAPTLAAVSRAREGWSPIPWEQVQALLVAEANAPGLPHLAEVENEVRAVSDLFAASSVSVTNATSATSGVQAVLAQLPSAALLHLACHGQQLLDPLDSHFALRDGGLTIKELMKMQLPHATLAFLSACETAKGSEAFTDQVVHLAASMLFCGFRSVIATMWSMSDMDGPEVSHRLYETLLESKELDIDDVPYALDAATQSLRDRGVPADRWATFVVVAG